MIDRDGQSLTWRGSINAAHANRGRVRDAYSTRCAPQVHGAARDGFQFAGKVFTIEANAARRWRWPPM